MTYAEIVSKNRDLHKGTFMDKSWRYNQQAVEVEGQTYLQTFKNGGYSYQAVLSRMVKNFKLNQEKVGYIEQVINSKDERTEEEKLVIKKL